MPKYSKMTSSSCPLSSSSPTRRLTSRTHPISGFLFKVYALKMILKAYTVSHKWISARLPIELHSRPVCIWVRYSSTDPHRQPFSASATRRTTIFRFDRPGSSAISDLVSAGAPFASTGTGTISLASGFAGFTQSCDLCRASILSCYRNPFLYISYTVVRS